MSNQHSSKDRLVILGWYPLSQLSFSVEMEYQISKLCAHVAVKKELLLQTVFVRNALILQVFL